MQGQTNLFKRRSVYWFRKKVPVDLSDHYTEGRTGEFRFSLRTRDKVAAKALAVELKLTRFRGAPTIKQEGALTLSHFPDGF